MTKILLTDIQRFTLHDGPGIRTTVFLKGCPLRCPWCSNPEGQHPYKERYVIDGKEGIYGRYMSCDEIYRELIKDKIFYMEADDSFPVSDQDRAEKLTGGVTFSGGEPLDQIKETKTLLQRLKKDKIHIAVETSLFVSKESLLISMEYIDLFYVDIKLLDKDRCREILKGDLDMYLEALELLFTTDIPVVFRVPVIGGYTDTAEAQKDVLALLKKYRPIKVELLKAHDLGEEKYRALKRHIPVYGKIADGVMEEYKKSIAGIGLPVQVYQI